jgi:NAD kinase
MIKAFKNILVVVKQTPFEYYNQQRAQGIAPVALRWERLKNRYEAHRQCVDDVSDLLTHIGIKFQVIQRQELHRGLLLDKDLVIAVGGDGTILNSSRYEYLIEDIRIGMIIYIL